MVYVEILQVSQLLVFMVASFPGVEYGPLFYRSLENDKIDALRDSRGNYNQEMKITTEAKNDLEWWIKNVHHSVLKISHGNLSLC